MHFQSPSNRRLTWTWLVLVGLTLASMVGGRATAGDPHPLGVWVVVVVLAITTVKAAQVLLNFLNLRAASGGWRQGFLVAVFLINATIALIYAFTP
ncbi:cytochrome C oxidase subunit IV family protein [Varunaivibrio sulfuroxidans]|uniref:Cytochrome c oxidase subunit IV n=1 Tax=Varunaivibrio sulfuroxidans TaxID=1773489 RepID=A0A4R3JFU2_9PROT|nr:cytochrome C oxidase subunit IV family protein [Varunaivibrio sulfuroxidans]TCS64717.1 cytochrome c oxidase subunit IV [Varunaivibrio sulfuroxidans]WES29977.1 cytochrome C oxidase subunit IV family protein [Varunaivibrio sulfuroxidans]